MSRASQLPIDAQLYVRFREHQPQLGGSLESFSETLREVYDASVPSSMRRVQLSADGDLPKRFEANGKRLRRYDDDRSAHLFPLILMPAFVNAAYALDAAAGVAMRTDVCRSVGSLYVPPPDALEVFPLARVSRLAREFGESCEAMAPIVEDGRIDVNDLPHIDEALRQLDELAGAVFGLKHQLLHVRAQALHAQPEPPRGSLVMP